MYVYLLRKVYRLIYRCLILDVKSLIMNILYIKFFFFFKFVYVVNDISSVGIV